MPSLTYTDYMPKHGVAEITHTHTQIRFHT